MYWVVVLSVHCALPIQPATLTFFPGTVFAEFAERLATYTQLLQALSFTL
jgi:hypothetical protein